MTDSKMHCVELKVLTVGALTFKEDLQNIAYKTNAWLHKGGCINSLKEYPENDVYKKFHDDLIETTKKRGPFIPIFIRETNDLRRLVGITQGKIYIEEDIDQPGTDNMAAYISAILVENDQFSCNSNIPVHLQIHSILDKNHVIQAIELEKLTEAFCYKSEGNNVH